MGRFNVISVELDEHGNWIIPENLARHLGLERGAKIRVEEDLAGVHISRSSDRLAKVYIEPTDRCNLTCRMCIRNSWEGKLGSMSMSTFSRILDDIRKLPVLPTLFFGGFGEPLSHPSILDMLSAAKGAGLKVEMITNGILLDEPMVLRLMDIRLDRLWVSIDGAKSESYADIRLGNYLPQILKNLGTLRRLKLIRGSFMPQLGIAFVAMKRNIADLPEVIRLGKGVGADSFMVTNLLPYEQESASQILYGRSMNEAWVEASEWTPVLDLPRMDSSPLDNRKLPGYAVGVTNIRSVRKDIRTGGDSCPFIESGSISFRWDGAASPCFPLMYSHNSYLDDRLRKNHSYIIGSIQEASLQDLWGDKEYRRFREIHYEFGFSPCTICNSCEMADSNLEDCFGNTHPTCGGCLWAQGFIQCP